MEENNERLDQQIGGAWEETEPETTGEDLGEAGENGGDPSQSGEAGQLPPEGGASPRGDEGQGETPAQPEQPEKAAEPGAETFTLKHLDEVRQVGKEEVVSLAQKGLDYDRIRTERDELRQYRQEADPALALVKGYAEKNAMTVGEYIDYCRRQELVAQGVNEPTARAQVELEKRQARMEAQTRAEAEAQRRQEAILQQARERQESRKRDMTAFLEAFPGVKGEDVPREVWAKVAAGESLVTAYTMYQNQQLQLQLAAQRQNRENAARTPGSMSTQGEKAGKTLGDLWDEVGE